MKERFRKMLQSSREVVAAGDVFRGLSVRKLLGTLASPIVLSCIIVFAVAIVLCWIASGRNARRMARDVVRGAAEDMRRTIDASVDTLLFYQGEAICRYYRFPEAISPEGVGDICKRYGVDEINVVDRRGIVLAGTLTPVGFAMKDAPETAEFNCLLSGECMTFAQPFRSSVEDPDVWRKYAGVAFPPPARGYIQIGFNESRVKDGIDYWFADQAVDWHIGEKGFYIIAKNDTGVIDSCGYEGPEYKPGATLESIGFDAKSVPTDPDEFFTAELFGRRCLCLSEVRAYHRLVTALPVSAIFERTRRLITVITSVMLIVLVLVILFLTRLSDVVLRLKGYIATEKERQTRDLTLAKTIQTSALPVAFGSEEDYRISTSMVTAREVGGDFYDYYTLPNGKIAFLIADVSGKGVSAALFMMRAKALIQGAVYENADDLARAVALANDNLSRHNDAEMFVTAWIATYDRASGLVEYVSAGHNPPLIRRANGRIEWVRDRGGLVLGAMTGVQYRVHVCTLAHGDTIFLYTDGVTEAMNRANEIFGEPRLEQAIAAPGDLIAAVGQAVKSFAAGAEQSDDITMLSLERKFAILART